MEIYTYSSSNPDIMIGSGSGIIITQDGYIVTNTHVLEGSQYSLLDESELEKPDSFIVNTYNDKQFEAEIVGRDAKTDIAVIKIKADNLPAAELGDSDETVLGERVAAIGNPEMCIRDRCGCLRCCCIFSQKAIRCFYAE